MHGTKIPPTQVLGIALAQGTSHLGGIDGGRQGRWNTLGHVRCRWDFGPMGKSPIRTGFDPPDIPHSSQYGILRSGCFFDRISRSTPKPAVYVS